MFLRFLVICFNSSFFVSVLVSLIPEVGDVTQAKGKSTRRVQFDHVEEFEQKKKRLDAKDRGLTAYAGKLRRENRYQEFRELALLERQIVLKQQLQQRGASESSDLAGK